MSTEPGYRAAPSVTVGSALPKRALAAFVLIAPADEGLVMRDIWLLRLRALLARTQRDATAYKHFRIATATWLPPVPAPLMLATLAPVPAGDGWVFERKWDGARGMARVHGGAAGIVSRHGTNRLR